MSSRPVLRLAAQFFIVAFLGTGALQISSPSLRALLLGSIWVVGIDAFRTVLPVVGEPSSLASLGSLFVLIWISHLTELLWVECHIVLESRTLPRLHGAYKMLFDVRRTALAANRKQAHLENKRSNDNEQQFQKLRQFRNEQLMTASLLTSLFWTWSIAVSTMLAPILSTAIQMSRSGTSVFSYIFQQLLSDLVTRVMLVAGFVLDTYMLDSIFHSLFALLFVNVLGWDSP